MSARLLLAKLAESGLIELPPRQRRGGRQRLHVLSEPDLFWLASQNLGPIESPLEALRPLEVLLVEARTKEANDFICYLHHHHYLGFGGTSGQNLRYLIRDCSGRDLACVLFAGAAWKVKARDEFIGWSPQQRARQLGLIVNNSRFLILPHVRVPQATHILGLILRRLRSDWRGKYNLLPCLAETFVERPRFRGVCYRAANWLLVGQSCGRSRHDRYHRRVTSHAFSGGFLKLKATDFSYYLRNFGVQKTREKPFSIERLRIDNRAKESSDSIAPSSAEWL